MSGSAPTIDSSVYILGAGGHGKVLAEIARAAGVRVAGFLDNDPALRGKLVNDISVLGGWEIVTDLPQDVPFAIGVGNNRERCTAAAELASRGRRVRRLIHPSAVIAGNAAIGEGVCVGPMAVIHVNSVVGRHCIINTAAVVDHECRVSDFAHASANVTLAGRSSAGEGSLIGVGACLLPGISVGDWSQVGAGSVVTRDRPSGVVAYGVPARVMGRAS